MGGQLPYTLYQGSKAIKLANRQLEMHSIISKTCARPLTEQSNSTFGKPSTSCLSVGISSLIIEGGLLILKLAGKIFKQTDVKISELGNLCYQINRFNSRFYSCFFVFVAIEIF